MLGVCTMKSRVSKTKATLSVDNAVWRAFRGTCIQRGEQASEVIEAFMRERLRKLNVAVINGAKEEQAAQT